MLATFLASISFAQTDSVKAEILKDFRKMGSNYYAYPTPEAKYTNAPAGYKPFYLSHYGRHGSRFHQPADHYHELYNTLAKADSLGKLTELGKDLLKRAKFLDEYAAPRAGNLTQLGVKQHRGIANRMMKNFPELFKDDLYVEAYSSTSIRCIASMKVFLSELRTQVPKLNIHEESGKHLMSFINPLDFGKIINKSNTPAWQKENEKMYSHVDPTRMMRALFNDTAYIQKNINAGELYSRIYEIGNSLQGSPEIEFSFDDLWTAEELYARWNAQNAWWYSVLGNNPFAQKQGLENAKPLLKNFIEVADKVIAADTVAPAKKGKKTSATLRFGHDTMVFPFVVLLQMGNAGIETNDMENLHKVWRDYEISPMAANVQLVFYKSAKKGSPILVKALLNEKEQTLPVACDQITVKNCPAAPYYRWEDFRNYYTK